MIERQFARIQRLGSRKVWLWPNGAPGEVPLSFWWLAWRLR